MDSNDKRIKFTRNQVQIIALMISRIDNANAREIAQEKIADILISYTDSDTLEFPEEFEFMVESAIPRGR
jgi:hypothetical protein